MARRQIIDLVTELIDDETGEEASERYHKRHALIDQLMALGAGNQPWANKEESKWPTIGDEIDEIIEIGRRIFAAIHGEGTEYSFDQIMTALMNMVVFQMSLVCPICRKDIARKIKRDLPRMVIYASQIAASNEDPPLPSAIASTNQDHR